jgi:ParB-like chromosome segregation protein Spo0J
VHTENCYTLILSIEGEIMSQFYEYTITPIDDLIDYAMNSRTHSPEQVGQVAASIREFGFTNPVLIDEDGMIIAGHGRVMAAKKLKLTEVPCIILSGLTPTQKKAYVIADNKLALNAEWDIEKLELELQSLNEENYGLDVLGFDSKELDELLNPLEEEPEIEPDVVFSEELGEAQNYIVLTFDNDMDWLAAQTYFGLESVHSKRANGKPWSKGIGRVVNGAEFIK